MGFYQKTQAENNLCLRPSVHLISSIVATADWYSGYLKPNVLQSHKKCKIVFSLLDLLGPGRLFGYLVKFFLS
jgi:hypothetical protein